MRSGQGTHAPIDAVELMGGLWARVPVSASPVTATATEEVSATSANAMHESDEHLAMHNYFVHESAAVFHRRFEQSFAVVPFATASRGPRRPGPRRGALRTCRGTT